MSILATYYMSLIDFFLVKYTFFIKNTQIKFGGSKLMCNFALAKQNG